MSNIQHDSARINEMAVKDFIKNGVVPDKPGFYDSPNFVKIEKQYPDFLNNYAYYVHTKTYDEDYLSQAEEDIPFISKLLHGELVKDGRLGACIDLSMVLSRVLEVEGYWNYMVKGALAIEYPKGSGISTSYYWPIDTDVRIKAGHVWLSAPPFNVIDISIKQQPYKRGRSRYLPDYVFDKSISDCDIDVEEVCSPDVIMDLIGRGAGKSEILSIVAPNLSNISKVLRPTVHSYSGTMIKYSPVSTSAPEEGLEKITSLRLGKKYGIEIYNDIIKPALQQMREYSK